MNQYADDGTPITPWDPTKDEPAVAKDTQSSDVSKPSGLKQAWDAWSSKPQNNAALLQFGLNMLQPRAPGQSAVGQFASAIGSGAEASGRESALESAEQKAEEEMALKERAATSKETEAEAYAKYMQGQRGGQGIENRIRLAQLQAALRGQGQANTRFQKWLTNEGGAFMVDDPRFKAVTSKFPNVKSKEDLEKPENVEARRFALGLFRNDDLEAGGGGGAGADSAGATPPNRPGFVPPPGAVPRSFNGRTYWYDPVTKQPIPGQ